MKAWLPGIVLAALFAATSARCGVLDIDDSDANPAEFILRQWIDASGGADRLAAVRTYEYTQEVDSGPHAPKVTIRMAANTEGRFRLETIGGPGGRRVQAFDGRIGWQSHGDWGIGPLSTQEVRTVFGQASLPNPLRMLQGYTQFDLLPSEDEAGRPCFVVALSGEGKPDEKGYFDKETHLLVRIVSMDASQPIRVAVDYSDFRESAGVTLARGIRVVIGSYSAMVHDTELKINEPIDESSFVLTTAQLREMDAVSGILHRQAVAYGNAGGLPKFNTRVIRATIDSSGTGLVRRLVLSLKAPHCVREQVDTEGLGRTVSVAVVAGETQEGWVQSDIQGFHRMQPAEIAQMANEANNFLYILPRLSDAFPYRRLIGERIVKGRRATAVQLATLTALDGTYYFDEKTGRLIRMVPPRNSTLPGMVIDFSDFRSLGRLEIPFVTTVTDHGGVSTSRLESIETDAPLSDDLFEAPSGGN